MVPAVRMYRDNLIVGTTNGFMRAVARSVEHTGVMVNALARTIETRGLPDNDMLRINTEIARQAQAAVVAGYRSRLPRQSIGYNAGSRQTGRLGPALASESMLEGTSPRVISFINTDHLNQAASHWYRVNYGSIGPNLTAPGGQKSETFTVNLNGRPFIVLRDDRAPSRANFLPANFFFIKGPTNMLIASRGPAENARAKGARPAHFIDLGLEVVAEEFPRRYQAFFNTYAKTAIGEAAMVRRKIRVLADVRVESTGFTVTVT